MKELEELIICACGDVEHQIIFRTIEDDSDVYMSVHLARCSFFKRLWYGIKYIFGYRCKFGAFGEFILTNERPNHLIKLKKVVKWLETNHNPVK